MRNVIRSNKNTLETTFDQSFTSGYCSRCTLNLSIHLDRKYATQLIPAVTFVLILKFWSSLHMLASYIPLSAWTPHMQHIACPYDICHMPKYALLWLNMPYFCIWNVSYGHVLCGMWGWTHHMPHNTCPYDATSQPVKTRPILHCWNKSNGRYKLGGIFPLQIYA